MRILLLLVLSSSLVSVLGQINIQATLDAHNAARRSTSPQAANMLQMEWDADLANVAQNYANRCYWGHNPDRTTQANGKFSYVGENIYVYSAISSTPGQDATNSWNMEKDIYTYQATCSPSQSCGTCSPIPGDPLRQMCGHYTQNVWAGTRFVGCAVAYCPTMGNLGFNCQGKCTFVVCNYGQGGNYLGQPPYIAGAPCSQCPAAFATCSNGLCVAGPPTFAPTKNPTNSPTFAPTKNPTNSPTLSPTRSPTFAPTKSPTESPTFSPTKNPTNSPTLIPTGSPTVAPTKSPTLNPTNSPTRNPTMSPTIVLTTPPTTTKAPTNVEPTKAQTKAPSIEDDFLNISSTLGYVLQKQKSTQKFFVVNGVTRLPIIHNGTQVFEGSFGLNMKPLAVGMFNGTNQMLWLREDTNEVQVWNFTKDWSFNASGNFYTANSAEGNALEKQFLVDVNKDGSIGGTQSSGGTFFTIQNIGIIAGSALGCLLIFGGAFFLIKKRLNAAKTRNAFQTNSKAQVLNSAGSSHVQLLQNQDKKNHLTNYQRF